MEDAKRKPISDDQLEAAVGGAYLRVSQWTQFLSQSIIGPLDNLASRASGTDRSMIQGYIAALRATCVPGAAVADPVKNLWSSYNASGRSAIADAGVRSQLDSLLGSAYQYILSHS